MAADTWLAALVALKPVARFSMQVPVVCAASSQRSVKAPQAASAWHFLQQAATDGRPA